MHRIIPFSDPESWERAYAESSRKDVYYRHAYAELCACMGDGDPFLFVYEDGAGNRVCYAFIRRPLKALPFAAEARLEGDWYDIVSPTYGLGGPLCGDVHEQVLHAFRAEFDEYCRQANIVSEFVRFHPLLFSRFGPDALLGAVFHEGRMISAALCLREGDTLIYHLGASEEASLYLGMNVFQFHQIAVWARRQGLHTLFLGGGHRRRDSLFQFKHRFNSEGTLDAHNGKKVHHTELYERLAGCWKRHYAEEFPEPYFPAYRTQPEPARALSSLLQTVRSE
ncbi:MAG TPA: GNAT family N-acetyltransferase [Hyalangium sp.]|nr:GNAT family N-acetyltransferase [Hyalangium sp.]